MKFLRQSLNAVEKSFFCGRHLRTNPLMIHKCVKLTCNNAHKRDPNGCNENSESLYC